MSIKIVYELCKKLFFIIMNYEFHDCSRTEFEAIVVNVCVLSAKFLFLRFVLEHSFDFISRARGLFHAGVLDSCLT